ncbi:hypothetical protein FXV83_02715 [Bradyrhizobium hipponense]|uniref:Uncharacterized protein n=1 Tax=Bradyrhizobium hipponense TaxID=2605638 RepID=A0A5S4YVS1_9BRAD|nr:hypothetical protein FXV83_02715 [Bradyrhizobium hipponense]
MEAAPCRVKCETTLNAIAPRYRGAIRCGYRTDCGSAFPPGRVPLFDGGAGGPVYPEERLVKLSKILIASAAFAVVATSAFS